MLVFVFTSASIVDAVLFDMYYTVILIKNFKSVIINDASKKIASHFLYSKAYINIVCIPSHYFLYYGVYMY